MKRFKFKIPKIPFTLRVHGNNLLTSKSKHYLFIMKIMIVIMALTESVSWAYGFSLMAHAVLLKITIAVIIGTMIFVFVLSLDCTLIMLDRSRISPAKAPPGKSDTSEKKSRWKNLKSDPLKWGVAVRLLVVTMSMAICAPFINQFVFHSEITKIIQREADSTIAAKRLALAANYDLKIKAANDSLGKYTVLLNNELAGKGKSGRYGRGYVAIQMESEVTTFKRQIVDLTTTKTNDLKNYDKLVAEGDYDRLTDKYNVIVPQNSTIERSKAIEPILASPDAKKIELTIRSFLGMIFVGLVLMKCLETDGVKLYFNEFYQQTYIRYMQGGLDMWIAVQERYNGTAPMQPFRFREFMETDYLNRNRKTKHSELREEMAELLDQAKGGIITLEKFLSEAKERIQQEHQKLSGLIDSFKKTLRVNLVKLTSIQHQITCFKEMINEYREQIRQIGVQALLAPNGNDPLKEVESLRAKISDIEKKVLDCGLEEALLKASLEIDKQDLKESQEKLENIEQPIKELEKTLIESRNIEQNVIVNALNKIKEALKSSGDRDNPYMKAV